MSAFNRRDLLKFFGVGAIVAPVVAGKASDLSARALILEPPKIELIKPPEVQQCVSGFPMDPIESISLDVTFKSGQRWHMTCDSAKFEESLARTPVFQDVSSYSSGPFRRTITTQSPVYEARVLLKGDYPVVIK